MTRARRCLLDVGGTFIKCADGRSVPISSSGSREEIVAALREALGSDRPDAAAVAIPGPFDYARGVFLMKHKFTAVYGENFRILVGLPDDIPLVFIHDVNCMLLGTLHRGVAGSARRVALVTLGTGLGYAESLDGALQCNPMGSPARPIWNAPYRDGIAEDYVSKRGIMRLWTAVSGKPWPEGKTVKDLASAAFGKESNSDFSREEAREAFAEAGRCLGEILASPLRENEMECLLVGGQIAKSFALMEPSLRAALSHLPSLHSISSLPNLDTATFDGLEALLTGQ